MVTLDFANIDSNFKSTEFITEHDIPNVLLLTNGYYLVGTFIDNGVCKVRRFKIDLVLEKELPSSVIALNDSIESSCRVGTFKNTYYSFTNLLNLCRGSRPLMGFTHELNMNGELDRKFDNNMSLKGIDKVSMLDYLLIRHLKQTNAYELKNPIKIVIQDEILNQTTYGEAYDYYITKAFIKDVVDDDFFTA